MMSNNRQGKTSRTDLRTTAFEELMLAQDFPTHPCVICIRLELTGHFDRTLFQRACLEAIENHPLLTARLKLALGKLWWTWPAGKHLHPENEGDRLIHFHDHPAPAWPDMAVFDLTKHCGVRLDAYASVGSSEPHTVFLQFHHGLADGLGCLDVVYDLLQRYQQLTVNSSAPFVREHTQYASLSERNRFVSSLGSLLKLLPKQLIGLAGVRQFLMRQPVPICSPNRLETSTLHKHSDFASSFLDVVTFRASTEQTEALRNSARQLGVTVNDWLSATIFQAIDQFRRSTVEVANLHPEVRDDQWLRMMVPISMREPNADRKHSAANIVSCVFLDRTSAQIADREQLLASIHSEMNLIKSNRLGLMFLFSIWLKKVLTLRTRTAFGNPPTRCQTSFVFSNMGKIFDTAGTKCLVHAADARSNELRVSSCEVLAPVGPMTGVAITSVQLLGQLVLSLRYDPLAIERADAQRIMQSISQRIEALTPQGALV